MSKRTSYAGWSGDRQARGGSSWEPSHLTRMLSKFVVCDSLVGDSSRAWWFVTRTVKPKQNVVQVEVVVTTCLVVRLWLGGSPCEPSSLGTLGILVGPLFSLT